VLTIRYAVKTDVGLRRTGNEDAAYAGPRLLAVADGLGGHAGGEVASATVIDALRPLDTEVAAGDVLTALEEAVRRASSALGDIVEADPSLRGLGTTLTALLWSGSQLGLVHIGDSRAYLFRDGGLFQITHDHSVTQAMIDAGRLTPEEAASHPQRSLLVRALGASSDEVREQGMPEEQAAAAGTPDLSLFDARAGDRYLLCTDGLTAVVPVAAIREILSAGALSPEDVVRRLITLANEAGGPDNIGCAVADITEAAAT
jgi:protein phosphatase